MKELLKREDSVKTISFIDEITNDSIIGILWDSGNKSIPVMDNSGKYIAIGRNNLSKGWDRDSKKEYVENALNQENTKIYLFESEYELMKWCFDNEETF